MPEQRSHKLCRCSICLSQNLEGTWIPRSKVTAHRAASLVENQTLMDTLPVYTQHFAVQAGSSIGHRNSHNTSQKVVASPATHHSSLAPSSSPLSSTPKLKRVGLERAEQIISNIALKLSKLESAQLQSLSFPEQKQQQVEEIAHLHSALISLGGRDQFASIVEDLAGRLETLHNLCHSHASRSPIEVDTGENSHFLG